MVTQPVSRFLQVELFPLKALRIPLLVSLILFLPLCGFSQGEFNNWFFGNKAAITFNTSPPTNIPSTQMNSVTATASVSDSNGLVLFYSNGNYVFDRNHGIMSTLVWGMNSNQPVFAFKKIGENDRYWIFSLQDPLGFPPQPQGLYYSVIDMTLNGGLGAVISSQHNIPVPGAEFAYDRLTGTRHHNNRDAWLVTRDSTQHFLAYLISSSGISGPVFSASSAGIPTYIRGGDIKISQDGKKLVANYASGFNYFWTQSGSEFCSFDSKTGSIVPLFYFKPVSSPFDTCTPHWAEFSPNSKLLYIGCAIQLPPNTTKFGIFQYDATRTDSAGFMNSQVFLGYTDGPGGVRALQMAPDGKIYSCLSSSDNLSVINYPNVPGIGCGFQINGLNLNGKICYEGLPQFLQKYKAYIHGSEVACQEDLVNFSSDIWPPPDTIRWNFGDPASGNKNTSELANPGHTYILPGTYTVQLYVRHNDARTDTTWKTLVINPKPSPALGPNQTILQGNSVTFDAGTCAGCAYQWSNLTLGNPNVGTGQTFTTGTAGVYMVSVTSPNGCMGRDTVLLMVNPVNPSSCSAYEFWFAAPAVTNHTISPSPVSLSGLNGPISMFFTTDEGPATVTIDQPANPMFTPITCIVNNDSAKVAILTPFLEMIENKPADSLLNYGLRVTSDKRISATYEIQSPYNAASYSLYGKDALGQSFIIPAQHNYANYPYCSPPARNSFDLVATEDSTIVTIIPAKDLEGHAEQVPFSFMMNRGQTWSGRAISGDAVMHLGGTTVTSTRPIAITVTDDALYLPGYDDLAFDVAGDQLVPENLAGKEFIALAMSIPAVKTLLLCYAKEDNTTVIFNDSISIKILTVNQGECAQFAFDNITNSSDFRVASIRSDKPISVFEFTGNENEFLQPYHSFQASESIIPPLECHGSKKATISSTPPGAPWHNWLVYSIAKRENGDGFVCDPPNFITNVGTPVPGTNGVWGYSMHAMSNSDYYYRVKITNTKGRFFIPAYSSAVTSTGQFSKYAYFTDFTALNLGVNRKMCPGDCILLDAGAGWTSYLWSTGDTTSTILARSAGTYWVSTTEPDCQLSDTIVISYYPNTPVNLGPDRSICLGDSTLLNAGPGRSWYLWNTGETSQTIRVKNSGTYWVRVSDAHCIVSDTVLVSTTSTPVVTNNPPLVKTICTGEPTNIPLTGNVAGILFHWTATLTSGNITGFSADSGLSINQTLINNGTTAGVVTYHITPKIGDCAGTPVDYVVTVNPGIPVGVTIVTPVTSVCEGASVTFTAVATNQGITPVYQWQVNTANAGLNSPTFTYTPVNGDIVKCILTSSNTVCTSNNPDTSNAITMVVIPEVQAGIAVLPSINPVCAGTTVTITAAPVNGGSAPQYQWKVNGNPTGANNSTFIYTPDNGDLVTCQLTSSEPCATGNPATSSPVIMIVNSGLPAGVTITASNNPFCPGSPVTFTATPNNGGSIPIFQWKVNETNAGNNSSTFTYNPANGDSIRCILTSNLSCVTGNPVSSAKIIMNNLPAPFVTFIPCFDTITTINAKPFKLKGGLPLGGNYSGPGVDAATGMLTPSLAGTGTKILSYSYTNTYTCNAIAHCSLLIVHSPFTCGLPFTDPRDGKSYQTVLIGTQCWMAENLDFGFQISDLLPQTDNCIPEKYLAGGGRTGPSPLSPEFTDSSPSRAKIQNSKLDCSNVQLFNFFEPNVKRQMSNVKRQVSNVKCQVSNMGNGALYQWDELMQYQTTESSQGLCPPGWHVPSESEWTTLFNFYQGASRAGRPLQDSLINGFNAKLNGVYYLNSSRSFSDFATIFWSSTPWSATKVISHGMNGIDFSVSLYPSARGNAFAVRCIRDN
jgi:uncharacterized protein (TIGR02145 family)